MLAQILLAGVLRTPRPRGKRPARHAIWLAIRPPARAEVAPRPRQKNAPPSLRESGNRPPSSSFSDSPGDRTDHAGQPPPSLTATASGTTDATANAVRVGISSARSPRHPPPRAAAATFARVIVSWWRVSRAFRRSRSSWRGDRRTSSTVAGW